MQDALPLARALIGPRIVSGSVQGELRELAGVPIANAFAAGGIPFIDDVKAMARGAIVSAGSTAEARQRLILPEGT